MQEQNVPGLEVWGVRRFQKVHEVPDPGIQVEQGVLRDVRCRLQDDQMSRIYLLCHGLNRTSDLVNQACMRVESKYYRSYTFHKTDQE